MPSELEQILGQVSVQVQEIINQSDIKEKNDFSLILGQVLEQVKRNSKYNTQLLKLSTSVIETLSTLKNGTCRANELNDMLNFGEIKDLRRYILKPLLDLGYIAMTNPDKPTSSKQEYMLTEKGLPLFDA